MPASCVHAESPIVVDAWTKSVTRILVINRHVFDELSANFPQEVATILKNLRNRCEQVGVCAREEGESRARVLGTAQRQLGGTTACGRAQDPAAHAIDTTLTPSG